MQHKDFQGEKSHVSRTAENVSGHKEPGGGEGLAGRHGATRFNREFHGRVHEARQCCSGREWGKEATGPEDLSDGSVIYLGDFIF